MKPHKHADVIKQWADGAEIQFYFENEEDWRYVESPQWHKGTKYRVKPKTVTKHRYALVQGDYVDMTIDHYTYEEAMDKFKFFKIEAIALSAKEFEE